MPRLYQKRAEEHLSGYQARDWEVVDYRMYELGSTGLRFRGPEPANLSDGGYFTCLGAAQTFGCFCPRPYPDLLAEELRLPVLNLGYGGAGPEFFVRQQALFDHINRGRFAVVQVMSARSQSNAEFYSGGLELLRRRRDGKLLGAREAYAELIQGPASSQTRIGSLVSRLAAQPKVRRLVSETREQWVENYRQLLSRIEVPTVLLWFSRRSPQYSYNYRSVSSLFGEFPQLVTREMVEEVARHSSAYVACISTRGHPQPLTSRFTGKPVTVDPANDRPDLADGRRWTHNRYYPSPEMQEDAYRALLPTCTRLLPVDRGMPWHPSVPCS